MKKTNQDLRKRISFINQKKQLINEVDTELALLKSALIDELSRTKNKILLEKR